MQCTGNPSCVYNQGKYHCTIDLLFDWFGLVCFANINKIQRSLCSRLTGSFVSRSSTTWSLRRMRISRLNYSIQREVRKLEKSAALLSPSPTMTVSTLSLADRQKIATLTITNDDRQLFSCKGRQTQAKIIKVSRTAVTITNDDGKHTISGRQTDNWTGIRGDRHKQKS
jgi:hypothetical protein